MEGRAGTRAGGLGRGPLMPWALHLESLDHLRGDRHSTSVTWKLSLWKEIVGSLECCCKDIASRQTQEVAAGRGCEP